MKKTKFNIYRFIHTIDLKEYLEKVYKIPFKKNEDKYVSLSDSDLLIIPKKNTWIRKNIPKDKKNSYGIFLGGGNILDWEAIKHNIPIAETTPIILKNSKILSEDYASNEFKKIQRLYALVNFRIKHTRNVEVEKYLERRGINIPLIKDEFCLGEFTSYDNLCNKLNEDDEKLLLDVFIINKKVKHYLKPDKCFAVPIKYNSLGQVGYHGRYIADIKEPYFNSGYVKDIVGEILFGEDNPKIQAAIKTKRQLLLCKNIIDLFAAYQDGFQQTLSTFNKGVSARQFRIIKKFDVNEIIIGYHVDKYQAWFAALMKIYKLQTPTKIISESPDIYEQLLDPESSAAEIINKAIMQNHIKKTDLRKARVDVRNDLMSELRERGRTFLVKNKDIQKHIKDNSTPKQLRRFLKEECRKNTKLLSQGIGFVEFPNIWSMEYLDTFGAELKTLLYLLIKCSKYPKINFINENLAKALNIKNSTLREHKRKLIEKRHLIVEDKYFGKGKTRKVHTDFYPSTLPYARLDNEEQ